MANSETKTCQNCRQPFTIEPDDFAFYEKMQVPTPTWCPRCRAERRATFRNERTFHRRACDLCKKPIIAIYPADAAFPVYCNECWNSDRWDPLEYGQPFDPAKPLFAQNRELRLKVPRAATIGRNNADSTFVNIGAENKRGYFLIESSTTQDSAYTYWAEDQCKNVFDSAFLKRSEVAYESQEVRNSFRTFYSSDARECHDGWFLKDCANVGNALGAVNLRNTNNILFNQPLSKEDFQRERAKIDTGSYRVIEELKKRFEDLIMRYPRKYANIIQSERCSGNYIANSKNCRNSFYVEDGENIAHCVRVMYGVRDIMDCDTVGFPGELCYESINTALGVFRMKFCFRCWTGSDSEYCDNCDDVNDCFGCIGLRNARYCILNKQYNPEEYRTLRASIVKHMETVPYRDAAGRNFSYGEFFPPELSPFAYNETISQEYYPITADEARRRGYAWRDIERQEYKSTLTAADLPDNIADVPDSLTEKIIGCAHGKQCVHACSGAFRIVPQELAFYRKISVPLPRLCPNCRHYERQAKRNPMTLWHRRCQCAGEKSSNGVYTNSVKHQHGDAQCPTEFETSYASDRKEIVYCESCYNAEVV